MPPDYRGAHLSPCRYYRYALWRAWGDGPRVAFIGLNPSTADETKDDNTIRRCIGYAKSWGYDGLFMLNLFAFRTTYPKELLQAECPIGKHNDKYLKEYAAQADLIVAAWGNHGAYLGRGEEVRAFFPSLYIFGLTSSGQPLHPLRLRKDIRLSPWRQQLEET